MHSLFIASDFFSLVHQSFSLALLILSHSFVKLYFLWLYIGIPILYNIIYCPICPSQLFRYMYHCTKLQYYNVKEISNIILYIYLSRDKYNLQMYSKIVQNKGFVEFDPLPSRRKTRRKIASGTYYLFARIRRTFMISSSQIKLRISAQQNRTQNYTFCLMID